MTRLIVTGANSAVGLVMVERALRDPELSLVALVRSERAAAQLPPIPPEKGRVAVAAYDDPPALVAACRGGDALVHLPGLLFERPGSSYEQANVETTRAAIAAAIAAGVAKFVLVSACGADAESSNRYYRSKGEAEELVARSGLTYTIVRAPLILACRSEGLGALLARSSRSVIAMVGGGRSRQRPLDARDLAEGLVAAASSPACAAGLTLDLVGPEAIAMCDLVRRTARKRGHAPRVLSVPAAPLRLALALKERSEKRGGMTRDVLDVLLHEDRESPERASRELGLTLRTLDDTIEYSLEIGDRVKNGGRS